MHSPRMFRSRIPAATWLLLLANCGIAGQRLGGKVWYASDEFSGPGISGDYGSAPLFLLQYDYSLAQPPLSLSAMLGYGSGWDNGSERLDALGGAVYAYRWFAAGLGWHYIRFDSNSETLIYHGPELLAGVAAPFGAGFSGRIALSWQPLVFWDADIVAIGTASDRTDSYWWDVGLGYATRPWSFSLGYRAQRIHGDTSGSLIIADDDFGGPYLSAAYGW